MFGYMEKIELCKKIVEFYSLLEDVYISRSSSKLKYVKSQEEYNKNFVQYFCRLSESPFRLLIMRKSSLEERAKNLENRLKEIKTK